MLCRNALTSHRRQLHVDSDTFGFSPHGITTGIDERFIPGGCCMYTSREDSDAFDIAQTVLLS